MCTYLYLRNQRDQHILSRLEISGILFANELDTHSRTGFILYVVKIFKNATHSKSVKEFMKTEMFRDSELETYWCTYLDVLEGASVCCKTLC